MINHVQIRRTSLTCLVQATSNGDQRPTETSEEVKKTLDKLDVVGKFTGKLEDRLDSPAMAQRKVSVMSTDSSASARWGQDKSKQL